MTRVLQEIDGRDMAGTARVKIQRARETLGLVLRLRETAVPFAAEALLTLFEAVGRSAPAGGVAALARAARWARRIRHGMSGVSELTAIRA